MTRLRHTRVYQLLKVAYHSVRFTTSFRNLRRSSAAQKLAHASKLLRSHAYRASNREAQADFKHFCSRLGGKGLNARVLPEGERKVALVVHVTLPYVKIEAVLQKALQAAGFECVPFGERGYDYLRYDWLVGNKAGYVFSDFDVLGDPDWVRQQMPQLMSARDLLSLKYRGVQVGRFVLASLLRWHRVGQLNYRDEEVRSVLARHLNTSVGQVIAAARMMDEVKPRCIVVMDRGYSGHGELFDLALQRGIDILTWNFGYKSNRLVLKRYNPSNQRDHPLCPSASSWNLMRSLPWSKASGDAVRQELLDGYESQDLFSFAGTQFNKRVLSREAAFDSIGLARDKKIAVIFPHILWDGSFFYGEDLFEDYTEWLVETIKAACANDRLQWVIKLHPAHVAKAKRDNYHGKPAELVALEGVVDELPPHVKLVAPEAPISTYSLFAIADYVATVRGTVGIEAALLGIPAITAGTGRYDRRGFTLDSSTRQDYLEKVANLEKYEALSEAQIELAERYAYYIFLCRPLHLSAASLEYERDDKVTAKVTVRCQSPEQWRMSPDIAALAEWIRDGVAEDFVGDPSIAAGFHSASRSATQANAQSQIA